jgi:hypothetical protein
MLINTSAIFPCRDMEVVVSRMQTPVVPKASPDILPELATYLAPFASLFRRSTSRASVERYLTGLLTDLPRKNCDTIAAAVAGTSTERLQHLLTDATWDPQALDQQRVRALVAQSPSQGLLVLDDTGLPKQGRGSVGVARQYSGTLGKVANCQVVVSAHYVADEPTSRAPIHWPLTAQLYLPEAWATDPARRTTVHVPTEIAFQTKPELALALVDQARAGGVPFALVVADAGYGDNPTFLQGLDDRQIAYVVGVSSTFGVRLPDEVRTAALVLPSRPRGRGQPKKPHPAPLAEARAVLAVLPADRWQASPGGSTTTWSSANSSWPCACTGPLAAPNSPPAITASARDRRAGCSASARCQANAATTSGTSVPCQRTRHYTAWSSWPTAAGPSSNSMRTPRANVAWITTRAGGGMGCIGI